MQTRFFTITPVYASEKNAFLEQKDIVKNNSDKAK